MYIYSVSEYIAVYNAYMQTYVYVWLQGMITRIHPPTNSEFVKEFIDVVSEQ